MRTPESYQLSSKEKRESPVSRLQSKTQSRVSRVLERGKEAAKEGLSEGFNWALAFGIISGTANLILGNPTALVPYVLSHTAVGAVGGFGFGAIKNLIRGGKRK